MKAINLHLRLTEDTARKLKELAEADTRNVTNYIESLINKAYKEKEAKK